MSNSLAEIGEWFRTTRIQKNLSVEAVAEKAQMTEEMLENIEAGTKFYSLGAFAAVIDALTH